MQRNGGHRVDVKFVEECAAWHVLAKSAAVLRAPRSKACSVVLLLSSAAHLGGARLLRTKTRSMALVLGSAARLGGARLLRTTKARSMALVLGSAARLGGARLLRSKL